MSEKTIPVWLHQNDSEKIQIGVAGELDKETGAQPIEIWPEFKNHKIETFTIGDAKIPAPEALTRNAARALTEPEEEQK